MSSVDYLDPTTPTIPGQNYALISVVSPDSSQKGKTCAVKIYGVFNRKEEADEHAKRLNKIEPEFDIFLVETYKWLPVPPDSNAIQSQEYQDSQLNNIIQKHLQNREEARSEFETRKSELMQGKQDPLDAVEGGVSPTELVNEM